MAKTAITANEDGITATSSGDGNDEDDDAEEIPVLETNSVISRASLSSSSSST